MVTELVTFISLRTRVLAVSWLELVQRFAVWILLPFG
jgi:hypothetical protein